MDISRKDIADTLDSILSQYDDTTLEQMCEQHGFRADDLLTVVAVYIHKGTSQSLRDIAESDMSVEGKTEELLAALMALAACWFEVGLTLGKAKTTEELIGA